ncbi:MAG: hypothetical protein ACK4MM_03245 [Fervidobacterium sp.]
MKIINLNLFLSIIFSLLVTFFFLMQKDYVFALVLLTFSSIFLTSFREFGKPAQNYKIAHLYVGSIFFTIAAGYTFLSFLFSILNTVLGEEIQRPGIAEFSLWIFGLYTLFNVLRLKKFALMNGKKEKI